MTSASDIETYATRVELTFEPPTADAQAIIASLLRRIAEGCVAAGASLIGHIKCYGEAPTGEYVHCSITSLRSGTSCRGTVAGPCERIGLDLNVLVYGLPHQAIDAEVRRCLQALSNEQGMAFHIGANEKHNHHRH